MRAPPPPPPPDRSLCSVPAHNIKIFGCLHLHPEGHLERLDAGVERPSCRTAHARRSAPAAGRAAAAGLSAVACGLRMFSIRRSISLVLRIDERPLVRPRQESRLPVLGVLDRVAAGTHGDEPGQVLGSRSPGRTGPRRRRSAAAAPSRRSSSASARARGSAPGRTSSGSRRCRRCARPSSRTAR